MFIADQPLAPPPEPQPAPVFTVPEACGKRATVRDAYGIAAAAWATRAELNSDPFHYAPGVRRTPDDWIFDHDLIWMWRGQFRRDVRNLAFSIRARQEWPAQYLDGHALQRDLIRRIRREHTRLIAIEMWIKERHDA